MACGEELHTPQSDSGRLPVQVGRTNTVSLLGLAHGVGGLPVQVGHTNTVSLLGLAQGVGGLPVRVERTHNVSSLGLASFKICSVCARTLPHTDFSRKQHHSSLRKCKSCIRQIVNSGTRGQVLLRNHRMSNGLVDGMLHKVPEKKTQDRAIRCIKDDRTVSQDILSQFISTFLVRVMQLNDIAALGYNPASFKLCKLMTFIKPTSPIPRDSVTPCSCTMNRRSVIRRPASFFFCDE
jgi:hypothetical protein